MLLSVSQMMAAVHHKGSSLRQWHSSHQRLSWYTVGNHERMSSITSHLTSSPNGKAEQRGRQYSPEKWIKTVSEQSMSEARTKIFTFYEKAHRFPPNSLQHCLLLTWSHVCVLAVMCKLHHYLPSTYTGQLADCSEIRWKKGDSVRRTRQDRDPCVRTTFPSLRTTSVTNESHCD